MLVSSSLNSSVARKLAFTSSDWKLTTLNFFLSVILFFGLGLIWVYNKRGKKWCDILQWETLWYARYLLGYANAQENSQWCVNVRTEDASMMTISNKKHLLSLKLTTPCLLCTPFKSIGLGPLWHRNCLESWPYDQQRCLIGNNTD